MSRRLVYLIHVGDQRLVSRSLGMPSIGHSSVPTVGRVMASTMSRVPSGSVIQLLVEVVGARGDAARRPRRS